MCFTGLFKLYITATQQVGKTKDVLSALKTAAAVPKIMSLLTLFDLIFPSHDPLSYSAQTWQTPAA